MKELVAILSHADTKQKIEILTECVDEISKQGYDTLISSHIPVEKTIVDKVEYFIYDRENPLIHWYEFD
jgi:hypothetical protein